MRPTPGESPTRRPRKRQRVVYTVAGLVACIALVAGYDGLADALAGHSDSAGVRDPATGLLRGAEPRDLGPEDAPVAVLLVHGYAGVGSNFSDLPERLAAAGAHVRVVRLPGHGTGPTDLARTTAGELEAAVLSEVDALQARFPRVVLVGHSMGGALSLIAASQRKVDGLVLAAPYFRVPYKIYYVLPPETWIALTRPVIWWVYKGRHFVQVNRPEARDSIVSYTWLPTSSLRVLATLGRRAAKDDVVSKAQCPILVLHAPGDVAASYPAAKAVLERLPSTDRRLVTLSRSNHHIFWDYDADQAMTEVLAFVARVQDAPPHGQPRPPVP